VPAFKSKIQFDREEDEEGDGIDCLRSIAPPRPLRLFIRVTRGGKNIKIQFSKTIPNKSRPI
jgi:hypothetical protein